MRKKHPLRVAEYLQHILDAIDRATVYVAGFTPETFERDAKTQDAVIRSIEIIGEAANKARSADPDFAARHPQIPWDVMYGMRTAGEGIRFCGCPTYRSRISGWRCLRL